MQDLFTQTYISDISQFLQELDIYNKILRCFHLIILDFFIPRRNMAEILPIRRKTLSNQSINLKLVHLASMIRGRCQLFFKVGGQRSSFYCHIVGKRCRQDTVWTVSSRIIQFGTVNLEVVLSHSRKTWQYKEGYRRLDSSRILQRVYNWSPW